MIYPENFEQKIGFKDVKTLLKGRCISTLGTEWIDNHLTFMTDFQDVTEALERAKEFGSLMKTEDDIFEPNFFDVREALLRVRPARTYLEELELFDLKRSLRTILELTRFLRGNESIAKTDIEEEEEVYEKEDSPSYPALARMAADVIVFPDIIRRIDEVLNKYGKVKDTASPDLLTIRHSIEVTTRNLSHSLRSIITEAQNEGYIERDVTPTLRDGRLVIPVAPSLKRKIKGIIHDESASGKTVFIEPEGVVEANNRIRELKAAERREIIRILQELSALIRPHVSEMLASLQFLAQIDYLRALSLFSESFNAIVPNILPHQHIEWQEAIHPLLQQTLQRHGRKMNPLDIYLNKEKRILLISGPNAGGKSICLKTVGLLQYMLQCGMPICLKETSTAGVFEDIFIDIGDEQSIEDELSTYSGHLFNMKQMIKKSGPASLLLIDEFGSGTEPQIGGALAEGILHRFVENGTFGIITTHYQNLKNYAQSSPVVANGAMLYDRAAMSPLFVLQIGNPGSSFAVEIARKIGLPEEVIAYASDLVGKDYILSDKYLQDIVRDKMYWENKRRSIHKREKQLEEIVLHYEEEMTAFRRERKDLMAKAKEEAEGLLQASNAKIENTIREIREVQAEKERTAQARRSLSEFKQEVTSSAHKEDDIDRRIAKIKRRQERKRNGTKQNVSASSTTDGIASILSSLSKEPPARPAKLEPGNFVHIKGGSTIGRIDSINGKTARVLFGVMYTTVPLSRLEASDAPKENKMEKAATFVSSETRDAMYEKKLKFKPEIDLRGMRADEALKHIAYFVDDAIQLEQSQVRILHGTGTGVLREIVRNYLETIPGVKSFHDEHVQFGGAGITVVEFE